MENAGYRFTVHNDRYTAVLTGRTVKILRKGTKEELARFRDLKYAKVASFNPVKNMLVTKSQEPWLAFYCLDTMTLLLAIEIQKPTCYVEYRREYGYPTMQECGFCFSRDGKWLWNIENVGSPTVSHLVRYDCETFDERSRLFTEGGYVFRIIERHEDGYLLAGAEHSQMGYFGRKSSHFIAFFDGKEITKKREISADEYYMEISPYSEIYYQ